MSRRLASVFFAMVVLTAAMGLKAAVTVHARGSVISMNGPAPVPRPMPGGLLPTA
jgi:hypothetical protein